MSLQIVFAGTPQFAVPSLKALVAAGHEPVAVYTQADKPAGRGRHLLQSPVKRFAEHAQIPVYQPTTLRTPDAVRELTFLQPDLLVVVAYGLLLPSDVLAIPSYGGINVHASLLPRWRGAAPIQRAIAAGDPQTGITIMQMAAGLDTGDILAQQACGIAPQDTTATLAERLSELGAQSLVQVIESLVRHELHPVPQAESCATYAHKIHKAEAMLDWQQPAASLARLIRAFNPWPIAQTTLQQRVLRIHQAAVCTPPASAAPGTIVQANKQGLVVCAGEEALRIERAQWPGGKVLSHTELLNSVKLALRVGQQFTSVHTS